MTVIVYVTDARPTYQSNLLAAAAGPHGSHHTFRHRSRWINSTLWSGWSTTSLSGADVLIAYLSGNTPGLPNVRALPVRFGQIITAEKNGDYGLLTMVLGGWCGNGFVGDNQALFDEVVGAHGPRNGSFVLRSNEPLVTGPEEEVAAWSEVADQLGTLPEFAQAPMLAIQGLRSWPRLKLVAPKGGEFPASRRRSYEIDLTSIAPRHLSGPRALLRVVSSHPGVQVMTNDSIDAGYRFSRSRVILYVADADGAPTVDVTVLAEGSALGPSAKMRLRLRSSLLDRLYGVLLPGGSAAVAAGAGILPQEAPLWLKVVMVLVGSAGVGIATFRAGG